MAVSWWLKTKRLALAYRTRTEREHASVSRKKREARAFASLALFGPRDRIFVFVIRRMVAFTLHTHTLLMLYLHTASTRLDADCA